MLTPGSVVQILSQALFSLALALLFLAFFRLYRGSYLRHWAWSWLAHAVWASSGLALAPLAAQSPSQDLRTLALNWVFLAAAYGHIAWLLQGTYEFATGAPARVRGPRTAVVVALVASVLLLASLNAALTEPLGFALRLGLRFVAGAVAAFLMAAIVLRRTAHPRGLGRYLMIGAFAFHGVLQLAYLAVALTADPTRVMLLQPLAFLAHAAIAGGMTVWLLEHERERVVHASEEQSRLRGAQECVYAISEAARQVGDLDELFASIHRILGRVVPARNIYIALLDPESGELGFPYWIDEKDPQPAPGPLGKGLTEYVLRTRRPLLATPEVAGELEARGEIERLLTPSLDWVGVPLLVREEAIGVLVIQTYDPAVRLRPDERDLLVFVSEQVAAAIEAKRADSARRASEESYRRLFQANPHPMLVYDRETLEILAANDAAVGQYGYSREELEALTVRDILAPEEASRVLAEIPEDDAFVRYAGARVHRRKHGARIDVDVRAHGLVWGGRRARVVSAIDITEKRKAEEARELLIRELEAKNAELERFTYTVSHDLKSPLITIQGFVGLLERSARAGDWERFASDLGRISEAATKMLRLLDELLKLSRIGRVTRPPVEVPLDALVGEAVRLVSGRMRDRGVRVEVAENLPVVWGDRERLLEVFQNLLDNAAKFMAGQTDPLVRVGVRGGGDGHAVVFVEDNGLGIEPAFHERIFGLFERLDAAGEGSGVGLALVKRIVETGGGRIRVESPGQGSGATFVLTLPTSAR